MSKLKNKDREILLSAVFRYTIAFLAGLFNFYLFYLIFTPFTVYATFFLFDIFFETYLGSNAIFVFDKAITFEVIGSCVAGAAYYLLFALNLLTPNIKLKKRIYIMVFSFATLFLLNILRIFTIGLIAIYWFDMFPFAHKFSWYLLSILIVTGIWFLCIYLFKIKEIPFISDLKSVYKIIKK
ncbi:pacearchaeosortase [Candidatus Pacearchaeota archaeon]|nr:pacearchaeosortase [Candidatus Pacearchaeota archaeon]